MAKYKIKITKKLIKKLKPYWRELLEIERQHHNTVYRLEKRMEKEIGIKGIEFFQCDNEYIGIGNVVRTMPLIHDTKLEREDNK